MIFPVILAGGKGERFWPYSNLEHPKQLLPLVTRRTMLEDTLGHIAGFKNAAPTLIIASQNLVAPMQKLLGKRKDVILIGEPVGKNTAAAIGLASRIIAAKDPKGVMMVLTADHAIGPTTKFRKAVRAAATVASGGDTLVTFGIQTTRPETGYGYVESERLLKKVNGLPCHQVKRFHEKPSPAQAKKYHQSPQFFWNSGMFAWRVDYLWELFGKFLPDIHKAFATGLDNPKSPRFKTNLARAYGKIRSESIDYGIMEKAPRINAVIPDFSWDDIGSWTALDRRHPMDERGNILLGEGVLQESDNCTCFSDTGMVAAFGVRDLLVVQHNGVTLVAHKDKRADLKKLVESVKKRKSLQKYL